MGRGGMNPSLLDTHVLVWLLEEDRRLGRESIRLAHMALEQESLLVSAMTFWEVAMLARRQRIPVTQPVGSWRQRVLGLGIEEIPVSGDIGILATELEAFPADPADRIIAATALVQGATLITADSSILGWAGTLNRHDACLRCGWYLPVFGRIGYHVVQARRCRNPPRACFACGPIRIWNAQLIEGRSPCAASLRFGFSWSFPELRRARWRRNSRQPISRLRKTRSTLTQKFC